MNVQLRVVRGRPAGKELIFGPGDYYLGRGPECQVRFNSDWVSRQHCLLRVEAARATLRDLSSRNGTLVNGSLLTAEQDLKGGDQVQIGPVVFTVELGVAPAAPPQPVDGPLHPEEGGEPPAPATDSTKQQPKLPGAGP